MHIRDFWMAVYLRAIRNGERCPTAKAMATQAVADYRDTWEGPPRQP